MNERAKIPQDAVALLESGASIWAATSDGEGNPEATRVMGARVGEKGRALTLYVPNEQSGRTFRNLEKSGQITIFCVAIADYRAVQVKGDLVAVRESRAAERKLQEAYKQKFVEQAVSVGVGRAVISRMAYWPSTAVEIAVRELYVQTPGPQAGTPWR